MNSANPTREKDSRKHPPLPRPTGKDSLAATSPLPLGRGEPLEHEDSSDSAKENTPGETSAGQEQGRE